MKYLAFALLICSMKPSMASLPLLQEIRQQFYESVESSEKTDELFNNLDKERANLSPLYLGYLGATEALRAKHAWNPYRKLEYLKHSQITLGGAIFLLPENIELRFLRFSIQHYVPAFLGASKNLEEDRDTLIRLIQQVAYQEKEEKIVKDVVRFLLESKRCTAIQEKILHDKFRTL